MSTNPLEFIHAIQRETLNGRSIANAMCQLGLPSGDELHEVLYQIHHLAGEASGAVCEEASQRYQETLEQTNKMTAAVLDACLEKRT